MVMTDQRRDPEESNGDTPLPRAITGKVISIEQQLPGITRRLEVVEGKLAGAIARLDDAVRLLHQAVTIRNTPKPMAAVRSLPPSAEITQAGTRVVMSREDADEMAKLASRIRWWRGTAKEVFWGVLRTAAKWAIPAALAWFARDLFRLLH